MELFYEYGGLSNNVSRNKTVDLLFCLSVVSVLENELFIPSTNLWS